MIVERIRSCRDADFLTFLRVIIFKHPLYFLQRKFLRQRDCAFHAGFFRRGSRDRDLTDREHGFLYRHKELEREFLEFPVTDFLDLVQPQFTCVGLPLF